MKSVISALPHDGKVLVPRLCKCYCSAGRPRITIPGKDFIRLIDLDPEIFNLGFPAEWA